MSKEILERIERQEAMIAQLEAGRSQIQNVRGLLSIGNFEGSKETSMALLNGHRYLDHLEMAGDEEIKRHKTTLEMLKNQLRGEPDGKKEKPKPKRKTVKRDAAKLAPEPSVAN